MKKSIRIKRPIELKIWLLRNGVKQSQIARELEISKVCVCNFVNGKEANKRIAMWLKRHGCRVEEFCKEAA
mgnify:CR=1 FL=1